jgi:membrane protein
MRNLFFRIKTYYGRNVLSVLKEKKVPCILLFLVFALGVYLGVSHRDFAEKYLLITSYSEEYIIVIFRPDLSIQTLILRCLSYHLQFFALLFLCSLTVFLMPLKVVFICYRGYIVGCSVCGIIVQFGMVGVINCAFLVIPVQFFLMTLLILFSIRSNQYCLQFRYYKSLRGIKWLFVDMIAYYLLSLLVILYDIIVIWVIIRPFNLGV